MNTCQALIDQVIKMTGYKPEVNNNLQPIMVPTTNKDAWINKEEVITTVKESCNG